tara:strand:- start:217 stop:627 length:411 start_codon:yes stop_codon:yes gene_type:complete
MNLFKFFSLLLLIAYFHLLNTQILGLISSNPLIPYQNNELIDIASHFATYLIYSVCVIGIPITLISQKVIIKGFYIYLVVPGIFAIDLFTPLGYMLGTFNISDIESWISLFVIFSITPLGGGIIYYFKVKKNKQVN